MINLDTIANNLAAFNVNDTIKGILSTSKYKTLLPDMIKDRLNESGLYSTGKPIVTYSAFGSDVYAPYTIVLKKFVGQPTNIVTLNDTGTFHNSFALNPGQDSFTIDYNERKEDGLVSDNVDLDNVFNLSDSELGELRTEIIPDFIDALQQQILS